MDHLRFFGGKIVMIFGLFPDTQYLADTDIDTLCLRSKTKLTFDVRCQRLASLRRCPRCARGNGCLEATSSGLPDGRFHGQNTGFLDGSDMAGPDDFLCFKVVATLLVKIGAWQHLCSVLLRLDTGAHQGFPNCGACATGGTAGDHDEASSTGQST